MVLFMRYIQAASASLFDEMAYAISSCMNRRHDAYWRQKAVLAVSASRDILIRALNAGNELTMITMTAMRYRLGMAVPISACQGVSCHQCRERFMIIGHDGRDRHSKAAFSPIISHSL